MGKGLLFSVLLFSVLAPANAKSDSKTIIFSDQRIEGKIRRPQLVLITADQRPDFAPMVMQAIGKPGNITSSVSEKIIDESPYMRVFRFEGTRIVNYEP